MLPGTRLNEVPAGFGNAQRTVSCRPTSDWIVEVEVHPDLLEEVIADGDEPDLDRDLKVLEPPELPEQFGDLLVDLGGVADDQADAEQERGDRAGGWAISSPSPAAPPPNPPPIP